MTKWLIVAFIFVSILFPERSLSREEYPQFLPERILQIQDSVDGYLELYEKGNKWEKQIALDRLWGLKYKKNRSKGTEFDNILADLASSDLEIRLTVAGFFNNFARYSDGCCSDTKIFPSLIKALDDPDPKVRKEIATALGYYSKNKEEAAGALMQHLSDPDLWIQIAAVHSLGRLRAAEAIPQLLHILDAEKRNWRDNFLKQEAVIALRRISPRSPSVLVKLSKYYSDTYLKLDIVKTLSISWTPEITDLLVTASRDKDLDLIREISLEALLKFPAQERNNNYGHRFWKNFEFIISYLDDESPAVRILAINALGKLHDKRGIPYILNGLEDQDTGVKKGAILALREYKDEKLLTSLYPLLKDPKVGEAARYAFIAIAKNTAPKTYYVYRLPGSIARHKSINESEVPDHIKPYTLLYHPLAAEYITKSLSKPSDELLYSFLKTSKGFDDDRFEKLLIQLLDHPQFNIHKEALTSLEVFGGPESIEPIIGKLQDKHWMIRSEAARVLGEFGEKQATDDLVSLLSDPDYRTRVVSIKALGKIGDPEAIKPLIETTTDPAYGIREESLKALASFDDPELADVFIRSLGDEHKNVRRVAVQYFFLQPDPKAVESLIDLLQDSDAPVRIGAAKALGEQADKKALQPLLKIMSEGRKHDQTMRGVTYKAINKLSNKEEFMQAAKEVAGDDTEKFKQIMTSYNTVYDLEKRKKVRSFGRTDYNPTKETLDNLLQNISNPNPKIRERVARELGNRNNPVSAEKLIPLLQDEYHFVRKEAATSLGKLRVEKTFKNLSASLETEKDTGARWAILRAMEHFSNQELPDDFFKYLSDESRGMPSQALKIIKNNPDKKYYEKFFKLLRSQDSNISQQAALALGACDPIRAIEPLGSVIRGDFRMGRSGNGDNYQQVAAMKALGAIGTEKALIVLIQSVDPKNNYLVYSTQNALYQLEEELVYEAIDKAVNDNQKHHERLLLLYNGSRKRYKQSQQNKLKSSANQPKQKILKIPINNNPTTKGPIIIGPEGTGKSASPGSM